MNETQSSAPICLFDSGIGGLTVLKKFMKEFPNESYIYFADLANVPFGDKSKNEIIENANSIIEWLKTFNPKLVVMACNTSSTLLETNYPTLGMIKSVSKEIASRNLKKVTVWGTKLTIENNGYLNEIKKQNPNIEVQEIACPKLVPVIEDLNFNSEDRKKVVQEYIDMIDEHSEALIWGCTHYPLLEKDVTELSSIEIIDPTDALISDLKNTLPSTPKALPTSCVLYCSAQEEKLSTFSKMYLLEELEVKTISINTSMAASLN